MIRIPTHKAVYHGMSCQGVVSVAQLDIREGNNLGLFGWFYEGIIVANNPLIRPAIFPGGGGEEAWQLGKDGIWVRSKIPYFILPQGFRSHQTWGGIWLDPQSICTPQDVFWRLGLLLPECLEDDHTKRGYDEFELCHRFQGHEQLQDGPLLVIDGSL